MADIPLPRSLSTSTKPKKTFLHRSRSQQVVKGEEVKVKDENGLLALRYEEARPSKLPIAVTVAPPRQPPQEQHPALRGMSEVVGGKGKRDSGMVSCGTVSEKATEGSMLDEGQGSSVLGVKIDFESSSTLLPQVSPPIERPPLQAKIPGEGLQRGSTGSVSLSGWRRKGSVPKTPKTPADRGEEGEGFTPITTPVPTESFLEQEFLDSISFSKRGSIMLGGKKAVNGHARLKGGRRYVHPHRQRGRQREGLLILE